METRRTLNTEPEALQHLVVRKLKGILQGNWGGVLVCRKTEEVGKVSHMNKLFQRESNDMSNVPGRLKNVNWELVIGFGNMEVIGDFDKHLWRVAKKKAWMERAQKGRKWRMWGIDGYFKGFWCNGKWGNGRVTTMADEVKQKDFCCFVLFCFEWEILPSICMMIKIIRSEERTDSEEGDWCPAVSRNWWHWCTNGGVAFIQEHGQSSTVTEGKQS